MKLAELLAALEKISTAIEGAPELVQAVENVFTAQRTGQPLTQAMRHVEVLAAQKLEGI